MILVAAAIGGDVVEVQGQGVVGLGDRGKRDGDNTKNKSLIYMKLYSIHGA